MTALRIASPLYTLLVEDRGAQLWDAEGRVLAALPEIPGGGSARLVWGAILKEQLPKEARVQILLARGGLEIQCQAAPYLSPREQGEVVRRIVHAEGAGQPWNYAYAFDGDPQAEGGHQLWVAWHAEREMDDWVAALAQAGATLVFATPWQRAFLAGLEGASPVRFCLALEPGSGRLLLFRGRELVLMRAFRLPAGLELADLDAEGAELLTELVVEECSRTVQFIKQKHRAIALEELDIVGLPQVPEALAERLGRGVRLAVGHALPSLPAFLLRGMERERGHKGGLNLVPLHIQDANRLRLLRLTVWTAAAAMVLGLGAAHLILLRNERSLKQILVSAEAARDQRRRLAREAELAGRLRFGLIRLRHAEQRQKASTEQLERLGLAIFGVPKGISLESVDVEQLPGDGVRFRFEISGTALTGQRFSVGPLADYLRRLGNHPGMQLDPLREVSVSDRTAVSGGSQGPTDRAVARFKLSGSAP